MTRLHAVPDRYRLQPGDIAAPGVVVTIHNVSYQGLEQVNPVLHLLEYPTKPLVLSPQQCAALIRVLQSAMAAQWIGRVIFLVVEQQASGQVITIQAPKQKPASRQAAALPRSFEYQKLWSLLLLLLVLAAAFGAVYLLEYLDQVR